MLINQAMPTKAPDPAMRSAADQLEQVFLEEMLKYCGPRQSEGSFSGGVGEAQFESYLTRERAATLARDLDLGFQRMIPGATE